MCEEKKIPPQESEGMKCPKEIVVREVIEIHDEENVFAKNITILMERMKTAPPMEAIELSKEIRSIYTFVHREIWCIPDTN